VEHGDLAADKYPSPSNSANSTRWPSIGGRGT
jgi:hypothetical protein